MVEQLTLNQRVGGSSPPRLTTSFQQFREMLSSGPQVAVAESVVLGSHAIASPNRFPIDLLI
jgi:hypothetical protein